MMYLQLIQVWRREFYGNFYQRHHQAAEERPVVPGPGPSGGRTAGAERLHRLGPNPFGVPVPFRMLDVQQHGLSSPVIVGAHTYVGAKVKRGPRCELGYGYSFEKFCLYALSR